MRWAGHIAFMGEVINAYKIFVRKCEERPRCRCEDNFLMDHQVLRDY
jgi:hypothetical protein